MATNKNEFLDENGLTTFIQTGENSKFIQYENNNGPRMINYSNDTKAQVDNSLSIDSELMPLFQALSSVANALNKKEQLKQELTKLIAKLPSL